MRIDSPLMTNAVITGSFSGSFTGTGNFVGLEADSVEFANVLYKPTLVSGSAQVDITGTTGYTSFSSSIASDIAGISTDFADITNKPTLVSGSAQIDITETTGYTFFSSSIAADITGLDGEYATDAELNASSSALTTAYQSADTSLSSSLAGDIATNDSRLDTLEGKTLHSGSAQVDHDSTTNFVANEHIDHSSVSITAGDGLSGGGDITATRSLAVDSSVARTNANNTFSGDQTFTNLTVNGTGSFAYIQSVTGSAKVIGDAYIVLNNNTPSERYAGLKVFDSGSTGVSASLEFDGQNNDWFYEYSDDGGATTDHGVVLFGPEYATKGAPTYPTNNTIQKGNGGHHLLDSNITDDGSTISLGSNTSVTGNITVTGTVDGRDVAADGSKLDGIEASAKDDQTITAGTGLTGGGTGDVTISHADTSTQASVNNSGRTFIQDITLDGFGHVTAITSATDADTFVGTVTSHTVEAGSGLTGGGTVTTSGTTTLNIGQGTGITVNADSIQIADDGVGATQLNVSGNGTTSQFLRSDGDGSFTWETPAGYTVANSANNRVITSVDGTNGNAEANLTFDGSTLSVSGTVSATCVIETSALRCKSNIKPLQSSLQKVKQLKPVSFEWKNSGKSDIGFIAEEVKEVLPNLIHYNIDGEVEGMNYSKITSLLVSSIHELESKINELSNEIEKFKTN